MVSILILNGPVRCGDHQRPWMMFLSAGSITLGVSSLCCATRASRSSCVSAVSRKSKKKNTNYGAKSSDHGGHAIGSSSPIHLCPNRWSRCSRTSRGGGRINCHTQSVNVDVRTVSDKIWVNFENLECKFSLILSYLMIIDNFGLNYKYHAL